MQTSTSLQEKKRSEKMFERTQSSACVRAESLNLGSTPRHRRKLPEPPTTIKISNHASESEPLKAFDHMISLDTWH